MTDSRIRRYTDRTQKRARASPNVAITHRASDAMLPKGKTARCKERRKRDRERERDKDRNSWKKTIKK